MQHFTNVEVKKGSFVGFHYGVHNDAKTVVSYTSTGGVGSRSLQLFGQNGGMGKYDAGLPPGVTLTGLQIAQGRRIPMATFFVSSRGM